MKKIFSLLLGLLVVVVVAFSVVSYTEYNKALNSPIVMPTGMVNNTEIPASDFLYDETFMPFLPAIAKGGTRANNELIVFDITDKELPFFTIDSPYSASIILNDEVKYEGNDINTYDFNEVGDYVINITEDFTSDNQKGYYIYSFIASKKEDPKIYISNTTPNQGDLVFVEIQNVYRDYNVEISSKYSPSASYFNKEENKIEFYIPINYMVAINDFSLEVSLSNEDNSYNFVENISVKATEYETISFTVEESVTNSTVNSAAANQEYRDIIHPLYYTKDENVYWEGNFLKPTNETRVSSDFGQIRYINGEYSRHSGIDYAAPLGTEIYAANHGVIEYAGFLQLSGNTIVIEHGLGLKSYYMHMDSLAVETGDFVNKGDFVGTLGTTGYSTGPHLHYQVSIENQPVDPVDLYTIE